MPERSIVDQIAIACKFAALRQATELFLFDSWADDAFEGRIGHIPHTRFACGAVVMGVLLTAMATNILHHCRNRFLSVIVDLARALLSPVSSLRVV